MHKPALVICSLLLSAASAAASSPALIHLERRDDVERNQLLDAGLTVVEEFDAGFVALGDADRIAGRARTLELDIRVLDREDDHFSWWVANLQRDARTADLESCGEVLLSDGHWALVKVLGNEADACTDDSRLFLRPLRRRALRRWRKPLPDQRAMAAKPLVEAMVAELTQARVVGWWNGVVNAAPERFSNIADWGGCEVAASLVANSMTARGLDVDRHHYRTNYAANVVGTLPGTSTPDHVYVVIGHLDSTSPYGSTTAPGADDNASGSAMVAALAEVMAGYRFASTVVFITATGEEQGLYGSDAWAGDAAAAGLDIRGVLNADMIGWQGNGVPASGEDLDLIYNSASEALATAFADASATYATGLTVNRLLCGNMQQSDHWPFWAEGWPALCGITDDEGLCGSGGSYGYYHTVNDTVANCGDPTFYTAAAKGYLATLAHLADPVCRVPVSPSLLQGSADGANRIALSWTTPAPGLEYEVLRAPGGCSGSPQYSTIGQTSGTTFVDTDVSGGVTYAYTVRSVDGACRSIASTCVEAFTTGPCSEPPSFAGIAAVSDGHGAICGLIVTWPPAQTWCGNQVSYEVHRSTSSPFTPSDATRLASGLTGAGYTDTDSLVSGLGYHYLVRATDTTAGVAEFNTVTRTGSPSGPYTLGTWRDDGGDNGPATLVAQAPWSIESGAGSDGGAAYATGDYGDHTCAAVTSPALHLGPAPALTFRTRYEIETGWDKGEVQISDDGGATWSRLDVSYPTVSGYASDACGLPSGVAYFTGTNISWQTRGASLAAWSGGDIRLRWLMSSDTSVTKTGWWVDEVEIVDTMVPGVCQPGGADVIFADGFESGGHDLWTAEAE